MKEHMSTEARIFARQLAREVRRRERIGAGMLWPGAADWNQATSCLLKDFFKRGSPIKRIEMLKRANDRVESVADADVSFMTMGSFANRRRGRFGIMTLLEGDHPLIDAGAERGFIVTWHAYEVTRPGDGGITALPFAYASAHALGRFFDRAHRHPDIDEGIAFLKLCGAVGWEVGHRKELWKSGITVPLGPGDWDLYAVGSARPVTRKTKLKGKITTPMFDCRTVLERQMLSAEEQCQAAALGDAWTNDHDLTKVARIEPRFDFVAQMIAEAGERRMAS